MTRWLVAVAVALGIALAMPAFAETTVLRVAVRYEAPPECPSASAFWDALQQRTRRVSRTDVSGAPILLRVDMQRSSESILGRLEIVRDGLASEPRYVKAANCGDVLDALALTAALGIDPEALTQPPVEELPQPRPSEPSTYYDAPDPLPTTPLVWHSALALHATGALPVDLQTSWGLSAAWSFRSDGGPNWAPTIDVGISMLQSGIFSDSAAAEFGLYTAFLQACPLRLQSADWAMRPCGVAHGGILTATSQNISNPETTDGTWLSLGIALEVEYALSADLLAQLVLGGHAPLRPQAYEIAETTGDAPSPEDTRQELARTPALVPWIGFGLVTLL